MKLLQKQIVQVCILHNMRSGPQILELKNLNIFYVPIVSNILYPKLLKLFDITRNRFLKNISVALLGLK